MAGKLDGLDAAGLRDAYDQQPEHGSRAGRERNALDECKGHEDAYVAALMAAHPEDADLPMHGWARTSAAYAKALGKSDDAGKLKQAVDEIYKGDEFASKLAESLEQVAA